MKLLLVKYGKRKISRSHAMTENPAHFGVSQLIVSPPYSLHTEYAASQRKISQAIQKNFPSLTATARGVPLLWKDDKWALSFAKWLISIIPAETPPNVVEIHPPFKEDCPDQPTFLSRFNVFADEFLSRFPSTKLVLENRSGSQRHKPFLISTPAECAELAQILPDTLQLCVDFPQLFTSLCETAFPTVEEVDSVFHYVTSFRDKVFSIHLWGRENGHAHMGDLKSLFQSDEHIMQHFLKRLAHTFNTRTLYLVPETNSKTEHMEMLLNQIEQSGIEICS